LSNLPPLRWLIALATLCVPALLAACHTPYAAPRHTGDALLAAGFVAHPADTTARLAAMNLLPPETMTWRPSAIGRTYLVADPLLCGCVYAGTPAALMAYRQGHTLSPREETTMQADNNRHPDWDWSLWNRPADPGPTRPIHAGGDTL